MPETPTEKNSDRSNRKGHGLKFVRDVVIICVFAVLISMGIKTFLIRSFYIPSASMENTLQENDRIIVNELIPKVFALERGDVVVFKDPGGWLRGQGEPQTDVNPIGQAFEWVTTQVGLGTADSNDHLVKRVIGLPGDTVRCCNASGQMEVNGTPLDEPYIKVTEIDGNASAADFSVVVPPDSLWVMGDNRDNSCDSRCNTATPSKGFVPIANLVGKAEIITWPQNRWGRLSDYPTTFSPVRDAIAP